MKLLHGSLGHLIIVELKTGQLYRGKLAEAENNLNISPKDITMMDVYLNLNKFISEEAWFGSSSFLTCCKMRPCTKALRPFLLLYAYGLPFISIPADDVLFRD